MNEDTGKLEDVVQDVPTSDLPVEVESTASITLETEDGIPRVGRKTCSWCWGRGIAYINKQLEVCKCLIPQTVKKDRMQMLMGPPKVGKHAKGRNTYRGKRGTWALSSTSNWEFTEEQ